MRKILMPMAFAATAIVGVWIGNILSENARKNTLDDEEYTTYSLSSDGKIDMLLNMIDLQYVDSVDKNQITEKAMSQILSDLDPHSAYIPADELQIVNDGLSKSFSGIGVQFNIQRDTIMIVSVVRGGPSEKLGIHPGDRIVEVNDTAFVGKEISTDKVVKKLRGKKGSKVKVGIKRTGIDELLHFTIVRGDVPTNSVDASYMIDEGIGYVKVNKFGHGTYSEFRDSLYSLRNQGAHSYMVDLRENSGGFLDTAIAMINEFLHRNDMIVYTEGKAQSRKECRADGRGDFQNDSLVVLIDEESASASEIFAGAMQDNDRAMIIGRRSFGKGLVQTQIDLRDGSAIRLTIARYYIPSGRCIQKPYDNKDEYAKELLNRYVSGELDSDTVKAYGDSVQYFTKKGRVVYGGGGVTPDFIVPRDTVGATPYFVKIHASIYECAFKYVDEHRAVLSEMGLKELCAYLDKQPLCQMAMDYATQNKITTDKPVLKQTQSLIERRMKEYVVRIVLGEEAFYKVYNQSDNVVKYALKKMKK